MPWTYKVGDTPSHGLYACTNCGWEVEVSSSQTSLPPCGRCGMWKSAKYRRVG